jgi:hypothetical protein
MKKYIDNNTRFILKWYFPALGTVMILQNKRWWGWKNICWTYPSIFEDKEDGRIFKHLLWKASYKPTTDKEAGLEIMVKDKLNNKKQA